MKGKLILLAVLVAASAAAALALLRPAGEKALSTTGIYADDWMANCGPLQGPAQAKCTSRLDSAYGRLVGSPEKPAR